MLFTAVDGSTYRVRSDSYVIALLLLMKQGINVYLSGTLSILVAAVGHWLMVTILDQVVIAL